MKGDDLSSFLSQDGGREGNAISPKMVYVPRRSDWIFSKAAWRQGKGASQEILKARSAIKMAHKSIEMSSTVTQETIDKAHEMISELEKMMEEGTAPSEGRVKKLNDLL